MSKLVWDELGKHKYEIGVDHAALYPRTGPNGTYAKGVAWNGLVSVTESPSGAEATSLYADDVKYLVLRSAEEFGGTIEAYQYPDEFEQCNGSEAVIPGLQFGQQARKQFALVYRTKIGNEVRNEQYGYKLHIIFGAMVSPSEKSYSTTNDSPEVVTFSWEFDTTPIAVPGRKPSSNMVLDSTGVNPGKLVYIENILYGSDDADPKLLLPAEVIDIIEDNTLPIVGAAIVGSAVLA